MQDPVAQILVALLHAYEWGSLLLQRLLADYVAEHPEVAAAVKTLGSAFNVLVNLTVLYVLLRLSRRIEKLILLLLIAGWGVFALLLMGLLNPETAAKVAQAISGLVNYTARSMPPP